MGDDFVKVYDGVPKNAYFAIAAEAKQLHLPFVGQVPGEIRIREASDAGQHSLEHGAPLSGGSTFEDEKIKEEMTGPDFMEEARQKNDFSIIPENIAKLSSPSLDYSQSG